MIKSVAHLTNNKDVFLCILRYHCRRGLVHQYEQMLEDMIDDTRTESRPIEMEMDKIEKALNDDRDFCISCELGLHYPALGPASSHGSKLLIYSCHILVLFWLCVFNKRVIMVLYLRYISY